MRTLLVELLKKGIEARLLLEQIRGGGLGGLLLERQMHAFVAKLGKGGPKLFTPWMALQDQELARED